MKKDRRNLFASVWLLTGFILWTIAVCIADVQPIGPNESKVGFATLNAAVQRLTGVHMTLYHITDWLGLVPIIIALTFALLGLYQWIRRKRLSLVDYDLFVLGGFYIIVMAIYVLFETVTVNYRPVLIDGILETSYPSSTTLLVMCVMPTAMMQLRNRIKNTTLKKWLNLFITVFIIFMVIGRLVSGVHWFTDIVGSTLLSAGLVQLYLYLVRKDHQNRYYEKAGNDRSTAEEHLRGILNSTFTATRWL